MAASLPEEIWVDILDYLESNDVVSAQRVSPRLLKLARDNTLWRYKCFEKAPSASAINSHRPEALAALTGALGGLSISGPTSPQVNATSIPPPRTEQKQRISKRARAVAEWDHTNGDEKIDWYSEYIARHAPISTDWFEDKSSNPQEIRGVATHDNSGKVVGCLEDGSVGVWDIRERVEGRRRFETIGRSSPGILFAQPSSTAEASSKTKHLAFTGVAECISIDSYRQKAYIAVEQVLNEVDLESLQVISQNRYAWPITALSQQSNLDAALSVGTSWSLHLYDPRIPLRDRSRSPEDLLRTTPADPEDSIAFLPNYMKGGQSSGFNARWKAARSLPTGPAHTMTQLASPHWRESRLGRRQDLSDYAHMEPGPLSILHHGDNEILIAGRFPSVLSYDRRYFPRLQYVMHSGARLSSIAIIPHPPKAARDGSGAEATLVACGEYGGRGSLELYSLPHTRRDRKRSSQDFGLGNTSPELGAADREHALGHLPPEQDYPYSYKNRQEASSAKLLSVATQGTRIVFSDAEGGLKWVERDGRGLARRWNINAWQVSELGAAVSGEQVARKIVPLESSDSERGSRGDGDLLIWTGEKMGIVTTKPQWSDHDEMVQAFEGQQSDPDDRAEQEQAEEYSKAMRHALERQADERRWMSQFRLKRGV